VSGKLKEVRERIKSVNSTQQITKAMKMVSAAKLRKAQQAITEMRPYANRLDKMLKNILSNLDGGATTSFGVSREVNNAAVVVVTSSRGLCGAFNTNIIKAAIAALDGEYAPLVKAGKVKIICVGKKGYDVMRKRYSKDIVVSDYVEVFSNLSYSNVAKVSQYLMDSFGNGTFDKVTVCYGHFRNAAMQFPTTVQYLPVEKIEVAKTDEKVAKADYIFEPSKEQLLEELIPTILQTTFQKFLLDTHASEHGARMTAMDKASENAEELVKGLKIVYNKARQEAITKELSEIVGGAAALGG
jgi:F-type H+-transporting ATPase subunit gamma